VRRPAVADPAVGDGAAAATDPSEASAPGGSGVLYVVATPIGNLGDITLRALEVLRAAPLVAAEDTRITRRLWARHGLGTRLISYHARNAATRGPELLAHLRDGGDLALVTDAGTPLVSDPGEGLIQAWAGEGGRVVPIPGPSAVLAALVASGLPAARWGFEGFLPRSGRQRRARIARVAADERATVLFEAPTRTAATLRDLAAACGSERPAALCRELTKLHEEVRRGTLGALAEEAQRRPPRGEVTLVVAGRPEPDAHPGAAPDADELAAARRRVTALIAGGLGRTAAAKQVAGETGLPRRDLYDAS
jgi:16S rRNA (cytidine1402-2'-O)-methyltransferase